MASALQVVRVPVLSDNYVWLAHDAESGDTAVIDPAVADPVLAAADARGWRIGQIWNTHWHPDHTGGNQAIKERTGAVVVAPAAEAARIPSADLLVAEGETVTLGAKVATIWEVPAHTAGHIAYHLREQSAIFVGDTLFAMGCGRLFEGTAEQMFGNMQRLRELPDDTVVYCAHEYTLSNGRFALSIDPGNQALAERMIEVERLRAQDEATVPTTIGLERATNPFLRARSASELADRRAAKDAFRG